MQQKRRVPAPHRIDRITAVICHHAMALSHPPARSHLPQRALDLWPVAGLDLIDVRTRRSVRSVSSVCPSRRRVAAAVTLQPRDALSIVPVLSAFFVDSSPHAVRQRWSWRRSTPGGHAFIDICCSARIESISLCGNCRYHFQRQYEVTLVLLYSLTMLAHELFSDGCCH